MAAPGADGPPCADPHSTSRSPVLHYGCTLPLPSSWHHALPAHPVLCLPDRLNPDWWRFLTGGVCRVGDPRVDPAGVPPLGVAVRSNTGPSYMPRGTACISAICYQRGMAR